MKNALKKLERKNPLRRVFLECHGWIRDPVAQKHQWLWCEACGDWRRITEVVE